MPALNFAQVLMRWLGLWWAALSECPTRSSTQPALAQRLRRHGKGKRDHNLEYRGKRILGMVDGAKQ
jgi:hypothetical protein